VKPARAISIRQPYVEQILRGTKKIEYRSIPTNIRERVYLYASLKPADSPQGWRDVKAAPGDLPTGVIVGTVEIVGCRSGRQERDYRYLLARPKRLRKPLRAKNQPQPVFWRPQF
jgi:ASCH domain